MLNTKPNALNVAEAALGKIKEVKKPVAKFLIHIIGLWLGMNCRYVFSNVHRWGSRNEKSYRNGFKKFFDWFGFNLQILKQYGGKEIIAGFDPSFVKKSGKQTYGLGTLERYETKSFKGFGNRLSCLYRCGSRNGASCSSSANTIIQTIKSKREDIGKSLC